jgi:hypothetical protein
MHLILLATFLPSTLGAWAAIAAAIASCLTTFVSLRNRSKIQEVHVLVNSNMQSVIKRLERVTSERDDLQNEKDADNVV